MTEQSNTQAAIIASLLDTNTARDIFDRLDKGQGIYTEEGKAWLAARAYIATQTKQQATSNVVVRAVVDEKNQYKDALTLACGYLTDEQLEAVKALLPAGDVVEPVIRVAQLEGDASYLQVYRCKIKSHEQIMLEIPREQQGWWADVAADQLIRLRQATHADVARCTLGPERSHNPDDYMCETFSSGALVSKAALEYMNPEQNVFALVATHLPGTLTIKVKRKLFSFKSEQDWINKAKSRYANCGVRQGHYITIDANGHVMHMGKCFKEATKADAYPVTCYELQTNWSDA